MQSLEEQRENGIIQSRHHDNAAICTYPAINTQSKKKIIY